MTKTTPGKRERTRQAIINAAMHIIANKGLDAASIDELMQRAGMARGTFYNYFKTREDVLQAVMDKLRDHLHQQIESRIPDALPAESVLACMIIGLYQYAIDHPCLGRVLVRLGADNDWFSPYEVKDQHFPRADAAILELLDDESLFPLTLTLIEGSINNLIRRTFLGQHDETAIEKMLAMVLRAFDAKEKHINKALEDARDFANTLHQQINANFSL